MHQLASEQAPGHRPPRQVIAQQPGRSVTATHGAASLDELTDLATRYLANRGGDPWRAQLVKALISAPYHSADPIDAAVAALAADDALDHQKLLPYALSQLEATPTVAEALAQLASGAAVAPTVLDEAAEAFSHPLMTRLLSDYLLASESLESLIVATRRRWLLGAVSDAQEVSASSELLAALALQMQMTEWVYEESSQEADQLVVLEQLIRADLDRAEKLILIYALYRPLAPLLSADSRPVRNGDRVDELFRRHLVEPAAQRDLATRIPRLTAITDPVSQAVRAQYEERPYPRWRRIGPRRTRRLGESVAAAVGTPELAAEIDIDRPRILIAGAGTGRHAVLTSMRYVGARVLAIDLSLNALAYAAYQAQLLEIENLRFAQADIAGLATMGETFDVLECTGVLHHMANPEGGWAQLRSLVRPGGLMKLGLYSRRGRSFLDGALEIIAQRGFEPTTAGIRATRSTLQRLPATSAARRVAAVPDFYSVSGCRDLFFHAHEDGFDLPRIGRALEALHLEFIGFELPSLRVRDLYRRHFPDDPAGRSLSNWDVLEQQYPSIFSSMYRFWARVPR